MLAAARKRYSHASIEGRARTAPGRVLAPARRCGAERERVTWKSLCPPARAYVAAVILLGALPLASALAARPLHIDGALALVMLLAGAAASWKLALLGRPGE